MTQVRRPYNANSIKSSIIISQVGRPYNANSIKSSTRMTQIGHPYNKNSNNFYNNVSIWAAHRHLPPYNANPIKLNIHNFCFIFYFNNIYFIYCIILKSIYMSY